jgi:hypothetical protein
MRLKARKTYLLLASPSFARSHHELNGTWKLIPTRGDFAGQPVTETGSVTINDREHNITVSRNFTYDGANQTNSYQFTTDGRENSSIRNGKTFKSKAKWEGDVLVVTTTQDIETTVEHFSLEPAGTLRLVVDRNGPPAVTLFFQRQ